MYDTGGEGRKGKIVKRHTDKKESKLGHGWWTVKWTNSDNHCRVGLGGFVDLKVVGPALGYYVYGEHLPDMGKTILSTDNINVGWTVIWFSHFLPNHFCPMGVNSENHFLG